MKFKLIISFFFLFSCTSQFTTINQKQPYAAKGFALIYNDNDFIQKVIKGKMNNDLMQISHQNLKTGTLINVSNPKNKKNIVLKNIKRIKYPDFYKVLITKPVAEKLELDMKLPILDITEIKKNKSFVAEKAKIYSEKKIPSNAPFTSVQISNISKDKSKKIIKETDNMYIMYTFYSLNTANFLKESLKTLLTLIKIN